MSKTFNSRTCAIEILLQLRLKHAHSCSYHKGDSISTQTICQQFSEFAISV